MFENKIAKFSEIRNFKSERSYTTKKKVPIKAYDRSMAFNAENQREKPVSVLAGCQ